MPELTSATIPWVLAILLAEGAMSQDAGDVYVIRKITECYIKSQ